MHHLFASRNPRRFKHSYCVHYWESLTHRDWLSRITPEGVLREDTNFARFARCALEGDRLCAENGAPVGHAPREKESLAPLLYEPSRGKNVISRRMLPWFHSLFTRLRTVVDAIRWLGQQAEQISRLPRVMRGLGWGPGLAYVVQWLWIQTGQAKGPLIVVRSKRTSYPLHCRPGTRDTWAFENAMIHRQFECLDEVPHAALIVDCRADGGYAAAELLTRFPSATAIVLEPDPATLPVLQANLVPYGSRAQARCGAVWTQPAPLVLMETGSTAGGFWRRCLSHGVAGRNRRHGGCGNCDPFKGEWLRANLDPQDGYRRHGIGGVRAGLRGVARQGGLPRRRGTRGGMPRGGGRRRFVTRP